MIYLSAGTCWILESGNEALKSKENAHFTSSNARSDVVVFEDETAFGVPQRRFRAHAVYLERMLWMKFNECRCSLPLRNGQVVSEHGGSSAF
ncbi:hypothetical protein CYMTET_16075 [Cymbomonas tetramitiformis]|uniref:Uncharacterized protein n=1 Tax=Cymbomonas tetramitiformis TaxID=36881 RepID=A0AAE0GDA7_9CHLO|nr:hypothetical protein CYMTET_16075 [Cymbomonas tetramitiformis]